MNDQDKCELIENLERMTVDGSLHWSSQSRGFMVRMSETFLYLNGKGLSLELEIQKLSGVVVEKLRAAELNPASYALAKLYDAINSDSDTEDVLGRLLDYSRARGDS